MKTHDRLSALLIWALCGLSAVTSGIGLWTVFDHTTESIGLSVAYAAAATTLLQALIYYFWDKAATGRGLVRTPLAGSLGLLVSLASAGFASGSYVYMFNKSGLEAHRTTQNARTVSRPLADFNRDLRGFAMQMDDISNDATRKAEVEKTVGGTCVGDEPQKNCGLRCRLRKRHARESAELAKLARSLSSDAVDIIADLQGDPSREGMLRAFRSAQNLASNSKLSRIASWLQRERDGFKSQFLDAGTGRAFVCRDPALEKKMRTALGVITAGFRLPDVPPEPAQIGFRDAIGKSYSDAFELARMLLTGDIHPERLEALSYSYGGYAPALAAEMFIIVLIFFRALGRRDRGCDWTDEELFGADRRDLPRAVRRRNHRWVNMILGSLVEDRRGWFVARPIDGSPDVTARWARMALIRKLPVDPDMNPAIPLPDLYPEWAQARAEVHGGARWFALHPITKGQFEWLRRTAADLEADLDNEPDQTPPYPPDGTIVDLSSQRGGLSLIGPSGWRPALVVLLLIATSGIIALSDLNMLTWQPRTTSGENERVLEVIADQNGHFYVTAYIGDIPIEAMVDTGATNLTLTYEDAERLQLNPGALVYDVPTDTANGRALNARVRLSDVRIGDIHGKNVDSLVSKQGALTTTLLGMSFLKSVRMEIEGGHLAVYY